jgi:hypothetical protein
LVSVKMPFTEATSGSISEVMNPHAKNSVVTAAKASLVLDVPGRATAKSFLLVRSPVLRGARDYYV